MATFTQTPAEKAAALQSLRAQQMVRSWRRSIDDLVKVLAAGVGELAADKAAISAAIGGDSTRPSYTEDLHAFNVQDRRLQLLLDVLKAKEL